MNYRYGRDWHREQRPIREIDEAAARQRFVDGPQLSVSRVSGGSGVPDYKPMPDARVTEYRVVDVSGSWRERPAFGDWDRFGEHPEPQTAPWDMS